jgi:hypothetical protein
MGCAGGGGSSTSARGPATPCRARAPTGGGRACEGSRGQGAANAMADRPATPSSCAAARGRARRGRAPTGQGQSAAPPGQGCGGTRCYLSKP